MAKRARLKRASNRTIDMESATTRMAKIMGAPMIMRMVLSMGCIFSIAYGKVEW